MFWSMLWKTSLSFTEKDSDQWEQGVGWWISVEFLRTASVTISVFPLFSPALSVLFAEPVISIFPCQRFI
jgi:hypothetical protein